MQVRRYQTLESLLVWGYGIALFSGCWRPLSKPGRNRALGMGLRISSTSDWVARKCGRPLRVKMLVPLRLLSQSLKPSTQLTPEASSFPEIKAEV